MGDSIFSEATKLNSTEIEVLNHLQFQIDLQQPQLEFRFEGYFDSIAVKGIEVQLVSQQSGDTALGVSDKRGVVRFSDLSLGRWDALVTGDDHEIAAAQLHNDEEGMSTIDVRLQKKIVVSWMILTVMGGLGIFLLGMNSMSSGLQTVAGESLRKLVAALTSNRFFALVIGVGVTALVQSSSITTVMVVGFVNSGIMFLREAVSVIIGANIGSSVTAWILVLAVDKWGLPLLGISAFIHLFAKQEKVKYAAQALMGIGMISFGLELMKNGLGAMRESPAFLEAFSMFAADDYLGVLKVAAVGCLLTMIIQSSTATMGIVIALASQGIIGFQLAVALVIGAKLGTTITAQLAALGANAAARRSSSPPHFSPSF